jgi:hypothetical protein
MPNWMSVIMINDLRILPTARVVVQGDKSTTGRRRIATTTAKLITNNHLRVGNR